MDRSEQVLVAMGALVFMVALKEGWLPFLRAWVTTGVGGPGINTLTTAGNAVSSGAAAAGGYGPSPQALATAHTPNSSPLFNTQ